MACEGHDMLGVLRPAMQSNVVWELRQRLHRLGFAVGDLDDERYDPSLQAAVRAFQGANGLADRRRRRAAARGRRWPRRTSLSSAAARTPAADGRNFHFHRHGAADVDGIFRRRAV